MAVILFIDLLGARARWKHGGLATSVATFGQFTRSMIAAARPELPHVLDGGIETDAAAFVCDGPFSALRIARRAFLRAFETPKGAIRERLWLRGALVPSAGEPLRTERPAHGSGSQLRICTYSRDFFDAVAIEKSGFQGMRLLVRRGVISPADRRDLAMSVGNRLIVPVMRLKHSPYPPGPTNDLEDFLWMAHQEAKDWRPILRHMSRRLRWSIADSDEFAQAAATQVLFHEAMAVFQSVSSRARRSLKIANSAMQRTGSAGR